MPDEVLPIAHVEGSVPKPAKKKETKAAATMTLLRRLLAADLVLGNAIRKLDLGASRSARAAVTILGGSWTWDRR